MAEILRVSIGSLAGALVGASLAFLFNYILQRRVHRREEKAAGNYAMATLSLQFNGFVNVRRLYRRQLEACRALSAQTPVWFAMHPILHFLPARLDFDFATLTFLFEQGDVETFQALHQAESVYRTLLGALDAFSKTSDEKQERLSTAGFPPGEAVDPGAAFGAIGPKIAGDLQSFIAAVQEHCDRDEQTYLRASQLLHAALERRFGKKGLIKLAGELPAGSS
jgi:hypothetical protein